MKIHYPSLVLLAIILLAVAGTASAAEDPAANVTPVITNVWFAKMTTANDSYIFELYPTGYIGLNDYGRMTFLTGAVNMSDGDYAIIQETQNGTALLKVMHLTKTEDFDPEFTLLTLELNDEDLAEPLDIPDGTESGTAMISEPTTPASTTAPAIVTPAAAATKAPAGMTTILAGLCIAGLFGASRLRR